MQTVIFFIVILFSTTVSFAQKQIPRINHVAFSVIDVKKSSMFYREIMGLDTIPEPFHDGRHAWFSIGEHSQLHVVQNPPPIVVPPKGLHLCFSVPDMNGFIAMLQQKKIHYEDLRGNPSSITTRPDGVHQIYFQDPDGYWLEINDDNK